MDKLPAALRELKPQRDHLQTRTVRQRIAFFKQLTGECVSTATKFCRAVESLQPRKVPKRILEITRIQDRVFIHLREDLTATQVQQYSCLSYCWGGDQPLKLTAVTAQDLRQGYPICRLPKTLRDAAIVSLEMGVPFIWIDALCIFQDSRTDWIEPASEMADVYNGGTFTICASDAESADAGFLQIPTWTKPLRLKSIDSTCDNQVWARPRITHRITSGRFLGNKDDCPLARRAWAFQEQLLSARVLRITHDEMIWDCLQGFACECRSGFWQANQYRAEGEMWPNIFFKMQSSALLLQVTRTLVDGGELYAKTHYWMKFWFTICEHYWGRQLTKEEDRLVALEGIVGAFKWRCSEYYAGIWGIKPHWGLAWRVTGHDLFETGRTRRPSKYRAPSWSWASIEYGGSWWHITHPTREPLPVAEIISMNWSEADLTKPLEGTNELVLWTFFRQVSSIDHRRLVRMENVWYDCPKSERQADQCESLFFVALCKDGGKNTDVQFMYQTLLCEQMDNGQLKRLGIVEVPGLEGWTRDTVQLV